MCSWTVQEVFYCVQYDPWQCTRTCSFVSTCFECTGTVPDMYLSWILSMSSQLTWTLCYPILVHRIGHNTLVCEFSIHSHTGTFPIQMNITSCPASHVGMNVPSCLYQSHIVLIIDMPSPFPWTMVIPSLFSVHILNCDWSRVSISCVGVHYCMLWGWCGGCCHDNCSKWPTGHYCLVTSI